MTIRCTLRFAPRRDDPSSPLYVQALQRWHCIHRFPQAAIWKFARQATPQRWASEHCQEIRNCSPTGEKSTQQIIYKTWLNEMIPNRSVVSDDCTIDNADVSFLFLFGMMISINNSIYKIYIYPIQYISIYNISQLWWKSWGLQPPAGDVAVIRTSMSRCTLPVPSRSET
jgi:hypothetical protein